MCGGKAIYRTRTNINPRIGDGTGSIRAEREERGGDVPNSKLVCNP